MLDLVSETEPQVERLGVEDLPPSTAKKPRRPSASPTPLPSEALPTYDQVQREYESATPPSPDVRRLMFGMSLTDAPVASQPLATGEILRVAAMVLSARALVLVFGLCAFVIAMVAVIHESRAALYVLVAWALLTVIPAITLEILTVIRRPED